MRENQIRWLILLGFGAAALYYFLSRHKSATALAQQIDFVTVTPSALELQKNPAARPTPPLRGSLAS